MGFFLPLFQKRVVLLIVGVGGWGVGGWLAASLGELNL